MLIIESILIFLFGLCIGSFLNVVIFRLLSGENLRGRSHCQKCLKTLRWYELIPLASFVWQKGKCLGCREKISWQYPLIEAATAIMFVLIFQHFYGNWVEMVLWILAASVFIVLFATDLKEFILPDIIVIPSIIILFLIRVFQSFYFGSFDFFVNFILVSSLVALPFFLFYFLSKGKWMGMGDSKLIFLSGLLLGWPKILIAVICAVFLGSLWGVLLMFLTRFTPTLFNYICGKTEELAGNADLSFGHQRKNKVWGFTLKSAMPFGPFIILGIFLSLYFGDIIYKWYIFFLLF